MTVIKILFVCHGNICRSPMAEYVMKDIVKRNGCSDRIFIDSCATSNEEIGHLPHPSTRRVLSEHGIECGDHRARRMMSSDYWDYDIIIAMDRYNIENMRRFVGDDPENKVHLMMDYAGEHRDVDDPWFTGGYEKAYRDISKACNALFRSLELD